MGNMAYLRTISFLNLNIKVHQSSTRSKLLTMRTRQMLIRKAHLSLFLWWAKKRYIYWWFKWSETTKFQEILLSDFRGVALTNCFSSIFRFGQFLSSKRVYLWEKNLKQNFLWICASTHYVLHNYTVSGNCVERFQRSCADKKNRTDGLTDWLTDRSKTLYPPQLVVGGINI